MIVTQPRISTTVVTLIATALSLASTFLFGYSVKEAMRYLLQKPRTLVEVSAGVALIQGSHISMWGAKGFHLIPKWKYAWPSVATWCVFGVTSLLVTGWTTLLAPTLVSCRYDVQGTELNMTSPAFSHLLGIELDVYSPSMIHDASFPIIDVGGPVSGIAAAGISFGMPGIINFNQAKYNLSTGGLLAAVRHYAGSQILAGHAGTRLSFSGGTTAANARPTHGSSGSVRDWLGIQRNFSLYQQGITADIDCYAATASSQALNFTNVNTTIHVTPPGNTSLPYSLVVWSSTAHCNTNSTATQEYVTWANASGQPDPAGTGFLPTVVCPRHRNETDIYSKFVIAAQGFYKYDFLPSTICEVTPLVTTTRVSYSNGGIINASQIISKQTFSPDDAYLLFFLAGVTNYHARNSQGLMNNIIGDTLYSTYSAEFNTPIASNTSAVYRELEDYWRGVIEFTATFLRAGYSAEGAFRDGIPSNMTSAVNGTMTMLTIGWANRGPFYMLSVLPIAIVTFLTVIAATYSLLHSCKQQHLPHQQTSFDVSDTLQLIMACSGGGLTKSLADGDLTSKLSGFDMQGLIDNERIKIKLEENGNTKKLVIAK
ncbi:hypothetical protein PAXRUDRAFT_834584 [Paxillus rubicundulus Ve08.2h10]|uniref:Uncharacterized protein n=1 Tax=Paxillus rubicundulus Ve08.2h10 TaxID=930991 RepID=A0A0D0DJS5_9AGAM|nr:hypothetical protein PAXRUDRAFT_834584 [Paxillus rubicundulus Ve08.2h10]